MVILPAMLVIFKVLFFFFHISYAVDTITQFKSLPDDGSTLVSKNGTFELGFFNPGSSSNRYVGIWYKNIPVRTVVWVANRDNPINYNSSRLIISKEGNLVLLSQNQTLLWSTYCTKKPSNPIVQLLDTGNLVLVDEKSNNNETSFLWQSFDHPGDTLLPGQKIGLDRKTGLDRRLTTWKNWDDPSSGDLTLSIVNTSNPEMVIWRGSDMLYRSGPWNGIDFSETLALNPDPLFVHKFVNNEDEAYYTYTLKNSSVISIFVLNLSTRQLLNWSPDSRTWILYQTWPRDQCDDYNSCGAYGQCIIDIAPICKCLEGFVLSSSQSYSPGQGCVRSEPWSCGDKNRDGFSKFTGIKLPDTTNSWVDESMTLEDCKAKCLENCYCTAFANTDVRGAGSGCSVWFGDLLDLRDSHGGQDHLLYVRMGMAVSDIDAKHGRYKKTVLVVTITVSLVLVMLVAFSYIYVTKTKHKEETEQSILTEEKDEGKQEDLELPLFDLATIVHATNNFSTDNKLGQGGFGPVFKGTLLDGLEIAVKRLSRSSGQGLTEFKNEVILCAKLQHRNLVKVLGCCVEGEEKMLLYEYMPNKSLDSFLFDSAQSKLLDWSKRFNILCSIARGLLYLHQDSRLRIIHRDLKASNILLDKDMNPKISDFGMARMCGGDQIEGNTNRIVGTYGYMAPEYANDGLFSIKSDVFSFGVLLLEIVSGKKNRALTYYDRDYNLIGHAWRLWKEGNPEQLIDGCLGDSCIVSEALRCIQIGLLCLQLHPNDRPNMTSVVAMLSSEIAFAKPKEPGFLIRKASIEGEQSPRRQVSSSLNEVTISALNAR